MSEIVYPMCPTCRRATIQVEIALEVRDPCPHCNGVLFESRRACCMPDCRNWVLVSEQLPVCQPCGAKVALLHLRTAGMLHGPTRDALIERQRSQKAAEAERAARRAAAEVVYYARLDADRIKIGFTSSLRTRMQNMRVLPANLLAIEPGGRDLEKQRHAQFSVHRIRTDREEFVPHPSLLAHIEATRAAHDLPSWTREPDTKTVTRRRA